AAEQRWRDEAGVHRSQSRPRPSPREQLGPDRFSGLVGAGTSWRTEPGWRGEGGYRSGYGGLSLAGPERGGRPGFRPGASGSWRPSRGVSGSPGGSGAEPAARLEVPFVAGEIADRGPLERGSGAMPAPAPRPRDAPELARPRHAAPA